MSDFSSVSQSNNNLSQSQAYAAALQRAKQIAAKIQPNQVPPSGGGGGGGGGGGFKRSHDDSDSGPDSKRFTSPGSDYGGGHNNNSNMSSGGGGGGGMGNGAPNMSQAIAQAAAVAARLAATAGTTCEEQIRIPESIVSAFTGRGGNDTISHIQAESGCKVQLAQDTELQADQVCTLRGSRETVTKGREMLQQLAQRNGGGTVEVVLTINMPPPGPTGYPPYQELMIPGTKVGLVIGKGGDTIKQLQEKTGAKMVIIQDGPNQELIKPLRISGDPQKIEHAKQLVLDLIAQKDAQSQQGARNNSMGGSNNGCGGGFNNFGNGAGGEQCEVFVPKIAVGVVIGKGGDMIRKIQTECGCKLQFIPGKNDEPGDRRCLIQGTRQQVEDAKRMIDGLIENVMQRNQGNRNSNGNSGNNSDNGNSNYGYGYGVNHAQQPPREEITFMVPASKCGIVIGRGGETIKLINQQTGAYCEMDRNAVNPPAEKLFKCKGTSEQVEAARQMIAEKINMDIPILSRKGINGSSGGGGGGGGGSGGGGGGGGGSSGGGQQSQQGGYGQGDPNAAAYQQQQQWAAGYGQQGGWGDPSQQQQMGGAMGGAPGGAPAGGQQAADYSAQWIEYYKSVGMHREAEMVEQQLKAKQQAAAAGAGNAGQQMGMGGGGMQAAQQQQQQPQQQQQQMGGGGTGGGQTQDYSAQWAEYYRSIGKIDEAEAIEKQMKSGNSGASASGNNHAGGSNNNNNNNSGISGPGGAGGAPQPGGGGGYPQNMTVSQYAQYAQYAAGVAAAGGGGGYQQAYGGYGAVGPGYPGAPQPGGMGGGGQQQKQKSDKN